MNVYEIIIKKRNGKTLTKAEIEYLVAGYVKGDIPDYQMAAFLMAVYFRGMDFTEIADLTSAMIKSGKKFNLSNIKGFKVDKHSTGGVGDKISLILAPLVSSLGLVVPMISGRGLGHTGGTLDKLESISGYRTNLTSDEFEKILKKIGIVICGQTDELVPADRKLYALRDVTATVDSIPLIAASIMSKKIAEGIDGLVIDIKTGRGAFMQKYQDAQKLARVMIEIGKKMNKKIVAHITSMEQPLGVAIGNSLEVIEAIECLKGKGPSDVMEVTFTLAQSMLLMSNQFKTRVIKNKLEEAIQSGQALQKFRELIQIQGGDSKIIDNYKLLPQAKYHCCVKSPKSGFVNKIDALHIGLLSVELGCGRKTIHDTIDHSAGFILRKKIGDRVLFGEPLIDVFGNDLNKIETVTKKVIDAFIIRKTKINQPKLILAKIT